MMLLSTVSFCAASPSRSCWLFMNVPSACTPLSLRLLQTRWTRVCAESEHAGRSDKIPAINGSLLRGTFLAYASSHKVLSRVICLFLSAFWKEALIMKSVCRSPRRRVALPMIALASLAAAPHAASAQAVGGFLHPGRESGNLPARQTQTTQSRPASNGPVQSFPPSYQPSPVHPNPVFGRPAAPARTEPLPNISVQGYTHGPVVNVPDEAERPMRPGIRYRDRQPRGRESYDPQYNPTRSVAPVGPGNGFFNNTLPPIGPGNGFSPRPIAPVGPANGFSGYGYSNAPVRITTPQGPQRLPRDYDHNNYIYNTIINPTPIIAGAPPLLGGYYYGNYCDTYASSYTYPSVYRCYAGIPRYIFNPTVIVVGQPYSPVYATSYLPFFPPAYSVTYNENNYYVSSEDRAHDFEAGGERAREALRNAYPANSYQAAFADIARAWTDGDIAPLRRHLRDTDTRLSVFLDKKYSYSIASGDFAQITRDALDRLNTVSFEFTRLRKAKNGDVTAFGKHIYLAVDSLGNQGTSNDGDTVPFDQNGYDNTNVSPYNQSNDPATGEEKTVFVSYTLRHGDGKWYIIALDSSQHSLVNSQE